MASSKESTKESKRFVRTHNCGQLGAVDLDKTVELCGWVQTRRDHGGVIFVDLRDRYGLTQIVFDPTKLPTAQSLRSEFVLWCRGKIRRRPDGMTNTKMKTGEIEVVCDDIEILSTAKTPPFPIEDEVEVAETLRLKHRYLDLRRPALQKNLFMRAKFLSTVRRFLDENSFVDVETPILYKSTPEGARDFIVPSRLNPGTFYALPQSPQILKQLLMVSGFDRYYQIARCFRDEDLRADRQPEFSQIDIETSFLDEEGLLPLMEQMVARVWKECLGMTLKTPFARMTYQDAMTRFGSDKPDVRFGLEIQDISDIFSKSEFKVFSTALVEGQHGRRGAIRAIVVPGKAEQLSRKDLDDLSALAGKYGAKGLLWIKVQDGGVLQSPAAKFFSESEKKNLETRLSLKSGDVVLVVADAKDKTVCTALGAVRLEVGAKIGVVPKIGSPQDRENPAFLWVHRFPLMEFNDQDGRFYAAHHPFTRPRPEHIDDFIAGRNLENVQACAYDLVLNGNEVAGGSLRIYQPEVQSAMFRALGLTDEQAKEKFGFFMDALQYGTPPHGGIAFGVERMTAILCGVGPIRDVMAFPKTQRGTCLMSDCPSTIEPEQLVDLGISLAPLKK